MDVQLGFIKAILLYSYSITINVLISTNGYKNKSEWIRQGTQSRTLAEEQSVWGVKQMIDTHAEMQITIQCSG